MALTAKPNVARAAQCGVCDTTSHLCPSCPKLDGRPSRPDESWSRVMSHDPELGGLMKRSARAARNLAIRSEADRDYSDWLKEYQQAGELLAALYRERPALLGKGAKWG